MYSAPLTEVHTFSFRTLSTSRWRIHLQGKKVACSSKTLVPTYQHLCFHVPEDYNLNNDVNDYLKFWTQFLMTCIK